MNELIHTQIYKIQHGNFTQDTTQHQKEDLQTPGRKYYQKISYLDRRRYEGHFDRLDGSHLHLSLTTPSCSRQLCWWQQIILFQFNYSMYVSSISN